MLEICQIEHSNWNHHSTGIPSFKNCKRSWLKFWSDYCDSYQLCFLAHTSALGAFSFVITNSTFALFVLKCSQCFNLIVLVPKIRADHDSVMIHFHFLMVCWMVFLSLMGIMSPIYLHWIFPILQFEILSLMQWIFFPVSSKIPV